MRSRRPARVERVLAAAAAAALLAGCSLAPRYQRPDAPVAPDWPAGPSSAAPASAASGSAAGAAPSELGWRDVFGDERLQALVALALEHNRDLRVAALNVELTRAQYRIQRAERLPSVAGTAAWSRSRSPGDLNASGRTQYVDTYQAGAGVTAFELDLFGRVRSLSQAALEGYLATEEARRATHLALVASVVQQDLALRADEEGVALARQTLGVVEQSLALARRLFEAGRTSELDVRTAEAQVETARFNLSVATERRAQAENALVLLVGARLPPTLPAPAPLGGEAQPLVVADLPPGVPSGVLVRRPDVLAAEHALRSANASIGAARAAFFPSITLTAFGGVSSSDLTSLVGVDATTWSFSPRLNVPIFQGGALRASLDVAEVRKSQEIARYELTIQSAFREVADALVARGTLEEQLAANRARVEAEQRRYVLSELRYRKGVDSYLTVLTAQRDLFTAQQLLIQSRLGRLTNLVDLYRALGGGWRERTAAAVVPPT
jgi:multidrug efflux system outer membrane protein